MPNLQAKSLHASTARYKAASSPSFLQGHIQLALKDMLFRLFANGAIDMFVNASAIAITEPLAESIRATCGA